MKNIRYIIEAATLWLVFAIFRWFPVEAASNCGGFAGRTIGPKLAASRKAEKNLRLSFPEKTDMEIKQILRDMWDNLGRVITEYPHLKNIIVNRTELINEFHVRDVGKENPCVLIGGHLSNWEIPATYFIYTLRWPVSVVYRAPNNPYTDILLKKCRDPKQLGHFIPKSRKGARDILKSMDDGMRVAILVDQKYNEGIPVDFFGRPAMTSTAFAQVARKYQCPIAPLRVIRLPGVRFRIEFFPPIYAEDRSNEDVIQEAHNLLEEWIRERPGDWLWLHRRWPAKPAKSG